MKLSYSTRGWAGKDWFDFCAAAASTGVQGVEIDSVRSPAFCQRTSPTNPELAVSAKRRMVQQGLDIPCVGTAADFTDAAAADEIFDAIRAAGDLLVPYVTVFTASRDLDVITAALAPYLEAAEAAGLVLLVDDVGWIISPLIYGFLSPLLGVSNSYRFMGLLVFASAAAIFWKYWRVFTPRGTSRR